MSNESALAVAVAAVSQASLTLLGVDYYSVTWALIGALGGLTQMQAMPRPRALVYVCLSTLIGAALGSGAVAFFGSTSKAMLLVSSLVGGAGSQVLVAALLQAALARIKSIGGATQ